jgi:hypothetical protein
MMAPGSLASANQNGSTFFGADGTPYLKPERQPEPHSPILNSCIVCLVRFKSPSMSPLLLCGASLLSLAGIVAANFTSPEIGFWDRPRAALIRDNVYVEGGWLQTGNWTNGEWKNLEAYNPTDGLLFKLSLNRTFDISRHDSPALFETIPEYSVQNFYLDGYMFADYDELYAWG